MNLTNDAYRPPADPAEEPSKRKKGNRIWVFIGIVAAFAVGTILVRQYLDLGFLAEQEARLKDFYATHPALTYLIAFLVYVLVTGLSIPGATVFSLIYAWFFGLRGALSWSVLRRRPELPSRF